MRILVLFCGGTLVMEENTGGVLEIPPRDRAIENLLNIEPAISKVADLEVAFVENIDSSNMNPDIWDRIAGIIADGYDRFDGFVITHGTDTMAFTASALSFSLHAIGKPVVLTGSMIPGYKLETDARRNFVNAVRVATLDLRGVLVVFDGEIILGSRASKRSDSRLNAFESMNWDPVGEIRFEVRLADFARRRHDHLFKPHLGFDCSIEVLTMFPGMPVLVPLKALESGVKGLILRGFGSGNIAYRYLEVIERARGLGIPVVMHTQCTNGATRMELYDVGSRALNIGVIEAFDMSLECTITKLMWALKRAGDPAQVKKIMHTDYSGEINRERRIY